MTPRFTLADLESCELCPRRCRVDRRTDDASGACRTGAGLSVAAVCRHGGEEPALGGPAGVCNVFFARCNLRCRYCQNHQISRVDRPRPPERSLEEVVDAVSAILDRGVTALGFVSPTHVLPQMERLLAAVHARGYRPRVIYNSNAYDRVESLRRLEGLVDVFLPDFKYADPELGRAWSGVPDYPARALAAIQEMARQRGLTLELDAQGVARRGLIVRHLVLPGRVENTLGVLRMLASTLSPEVTVSLMSQYAPTPHTAGDPDLGRRLRPEEYARAVAEMERLGMDHGWLQDPESSGEFLPDFERDRPFVQSGDPGRGSAGPITSTDRP